MKRLLSILALTFALSAFLPAQEHEPEKKADHGEMLGWKWANFAILAFGLGYLIMKNVPPFFRSRTEGIQQGIQEASRLKAEAEAKMAEVERQFAGLGSEINNLKGQLRAEMLAEGDRIKQDTERMLQRIHEQAGQEISFMTKSARTELRIHAASLALDLAKGRIANHMNPQTQQSLVNAFVHDLQTESNGASQ